MTRAIIYARCSTDESKQDVELQVSELERYAKKEKWDYDIVIEYASGYKSVPPQLAKVIDLIQKRLYDVILVHSLDRFSRLSASKTEKLLSGITDYKCRFIAVQHNLDSDNPMIWFAFKGLFSYFSNIYSQQLSEKIKLGMDKAKEKGKHVGRPKGSKDKKKRAKKGYYLKPKKLHITKSFNSRSKKGVVFETT